MTVTSATPTVEQTTQHLHVSWVEYGKLGERLAVIIHESKYEFDHILCIARGGMFIGDTLSRIFDKPLAVISACSYEGVGDMERGSLSIASHITMATKTLGAKVLLVDDLVDSGATIAALKESVEEKYPESEFRTAVLWKKTCSSFTPDFCVDTVTGNVWIHQPFEKYDDVTPESLVL
jgi:uncharacterized protein